MPDFIMNKTDLTKINQLMEEDRKWKKHYENFKFVTRTQKYLKKVLSREVY